MQRMRADRLWLLMQAGVTLGLSSAAVALLPFKRALGYGSVEVFRRRGPVSVADCVWAVEAAARRAPWRALCIERGIAVQRLLRKRGVDALLHYGARHEPGSGRLQAHVWVTVDGHAVIGGEEAVGYSEIASFP